MRRLKQTRSLCPECLERIDADVFERDGQVWMDKTCADHGRFSALLAADARHYYVADPRLESVGSCCGPSRHCGDQVANHSCNMLFEITQRCNLTCPTCYAESSPQQGDFMPLPRFVELLEGLIASGKGDSDLIQLSGGEPTLHPDMFAMIDAALERGVRQVYINTNGIRLARRVYAEQLAAYGPRVSVYLQFDGFRPRTLQVLRGRGDLVETKQSALALCEELRINTVPVMTFTPGVNDDELRPFLELTSAYPAAVRKVMIQPAMYSGRYELPRRVERATVADVARCIVEQTGGLWRDEDFSPIPCSDPNCFSMALALRTEAGLVPVSRFFPRYATWGDDGVRDLIGSISDTFDSDKDMAAVLEWALDEETLDALLDEVARWQGGGELGSGGLFAIGIKPFMDAYTFDQDRIDKCCVHIIATDGTPVSFCEYNALNRPQGRP